MTGISETGLAVWQPAECPWRIEYSPPVLDEIRRLAVDAFFSLPRGGAEIGGILCGTHKDESVRILAFRPMTCEHAFGPTFVLSDKDKTRLAAQLEELRQDPALRGLSVIGWYHSHTRSEIFLSEQDLEIYRSFFPQPWQVALVLRPAGMKPTRAGFFFRDVDGAIHHSESYREFIAGTMAGVNGDSGASKPKNGDHAVPHPPLPLHTAPATEVPAPALETTATPAAAEPAPEKRGEPVSPSAALPAGASVLTGSELPPPQRSPDSGAPIEIRQAEFVLPAFLVPPEKRRSHAWLWVLIILLMAGAGAYFTTGYWMNLLNRKSANLHLQALDQAGQLHIQWDRESLATRNVKGGTLVIVDGSSTTTIPLDPVKIRSGSFEYARRSEMVEVHMTVHTDATPLEEFTSFIGQPPPRPANPGELERQQQNSELAAAAEKARADLAKEELRRMELEQSLAKMREAMRRDEARKRMESQVPSSGPPPAPSKSAPKTAPSAPVQAANNSPANNPSSRPAAATPAPPAAAAPLPPPSVATQREQPNVSPEKAAPAPRPTTPAAPQSTLSGRWVFSRASKSGSDFPPESATLVMTEAYGQVRGIFVGRYRVPKNRKFAPNVKFSFEGAVQPTSSKFPFTAAEGVKGQVEVIRLPGKQDAIEVVWYSERDKLTFDDIFFRVP